MIDMNKKYRARGGCPARILCDDNQGEYPIVGIVDGSPYSWTTDGRFSANQRGENPLDLVEIPPYADWPIDAPIWVRDGNELRWRARHFAGTSKDGRPMAWGNGCTSFSADGEFNPITWKYAKLASEFTPENNEADRD
jgi:hypothetical protein